MGETQPRISDLKRGKRARFALAGAAPCEEPLNAEILIELRPMDALTLSNKLPPNPLTDGGVCEPRVPREWHSQYPSIIQLDNQSIVRKSDFLSERA